MSLDSTQECTCFCGRMVTVKGLSSVPCSICECETFASDAALLSPPALSFARLPPALHQEIQCLRLFSHEAWLSFFLVGSYSSKRIDPGRVPPQTLLLLLQCRRLLLLVLIHLKRSSETIEASWVSKKSHSSCTQSPCMKTSASAGCR